MTDEEIINEIKTGNQAPFRELIERYEPKIAATVIGMLGNTPEAEDVGQEVFIRFYKAVHSFRGDSSVRTYLTRIAINLSLNELKRRKRKNFLFFHSDEDTPEIRDESGDVSYDGIPEVIQKHIQELDPIFRSVLVLRLIEGYSTEETASILELPIGTVLSRLARAQKKLKKKLATLLEVDNE